jgi:hypothetical protein
MLEKVLLGCGIASSVLFVAGDILASLQYAGYSYADQTFSELLAEGAPTRPLMIVLAGKGYTALVTAFGVGVWMAGGHRTARGTGQIPRSPPSTGMPALSRRASFERPITPAVFGRRRYAVTALVGRPRLPCDSSPARTVGWSAVRQFTAPPDSGVAHAQMAPAPRRT